MGFHNFFVIAFTRLPFTLSDRLWGSPTQCSWTGSLIIRPWAPASQWISHILRRRVYCLENAQIYWSILDVGLFNLLLLLLILKPVADDGLVHFVWAVNTRLVFKQSWILVFQVLIEALQLVLRVDRIIRRPQIIQLSSLMPNCSRSILGSLRRSKTVAEKWVGVKLLVDFHGGA